jgi:hypothetical protein
MKPGHKWEDNTEIVFGKDRSFDWIQLASDMVYGLSTIAVNGLSGTLECLLAAE